MSEVIATLDLQVIQTGVHGMLEDNLEIKEAFYTASREIVERHVKQMREEIRAALPAPFQSGSSWAAIQTNYVECNRHEYGERERTQF